MKKTCIAIIPARGGSKGIQRKNTRLLNEKPLITYVIEKALQSKCFSDVIVSTDDEEIAFIAKLSGATVISRPAELAGDSIDLDKVIVHAVNHYEQTSSRRTDYIATIQPTSPLLSVRTIQQGVEKCIRQSYDTVLTVCADPHLSWRLISRNKIVPNYKQRLNRQLLPKEFRETGGIVVCRRKMLAQKTRFGRKIGVVECDKKEAIDIDDRFDWWIAEKQLKRKTIVFQVEGYEQIGLGHIYRCLTLADNMMDHDMKFVISEKSQLGAGIIESRFYPVIRFKSGLVNKLKAVASCTPDIVVNDSLDTGRRYITNLKKQGCRVVTFEDLGPGVADADAVINAMYDSRLTEKYTHVFSGPAYVCLRDEFYSAKPIPIRKKVENILLLFGGTDPQKLTPKILKWILKLEHLSRITVIIGPGYSGKKMLSHLVKSIKHKEITVVSNTKIIVKYMSQVDVAITSAGRTVFELASLGIPMLVLSQNKREETHHFIQNEFGILYLGRGDQLKYRKFQEAMTGLLDSYMHRAKMQESLLKHNFKNGIKNVWKIILGS